MRRSRSAGFTLVELMVSLVAGLIVAIAVVALARTSTLAFHEQARLMQTQQSLRSAADRLRNDLTRVSFMGTGNGKLGCFDAQCSAGGPLGIPMGNKIAYVPGSNPLRYPGSNTLQGIRILVRGSEAGTNGIGNSTANGLQPDAIELMGNFTTDDSYVGTITGNGSCGGPQVRLSALADPATARLLNGAPDQTTAAAHVRNAFTPVNGVRFFARVVDKRGCQHYVHVQDATASAANMGIVDICPDSAGLSLIEAGKPVADNGTGVPTCGWGGFGEEVTISPLHRVRWYIGPNIHPRINPLAGVDPPAAQFALYREMLSGTGEPLPPPPAGTLPQIVAEYAVDLKFGIVVEDYAPPPNNIRVFEMDTDTGNGAIATWTQAANATNYGLPGPQRVRAVRFRISTRAAMPDRKSPLGNGTSVTGPYLLRYCVDPNRGCPPGDPAAPPNYARVRTITSEVALINQARMNY